MPVKHKGKSQRVLKGPRGVTMFLGILAEQSLLFTGIIMYRTPEELNKTSFTDK